MATARTWIGGGNNRADNPKDWSPNGVPQPGDSLAMAQGTINFMGGDYSGSLLSLFGPDAASNGIETVNLSKGALVDARGTTAGANATFNVSGDDTLNLGVGFPGWQGSGSISATVNLAANSRWIGNFNAVAGINSANAASLKVNPGNKSSFVDNGLSFITGAGAHAVINADVSGTANVSVTGGGILEFGSSVGYEFLTITLSGPSLLARGSTWNIRRASQLDHSKRSIAGKGRQARITILTRMAYSSIYAGTKLVNTKRRLRQYSLWISRPRTTASGVSIVANPNPVVVNFDNLVGSVPPVYGGITWPPTLWSIDHDDTLYGHESPPNSVTGIPVPASFAFATPVKFDGAWFAGPLNLTVTLFLNGAQVAQESTTGLFPGTITNGGTNGNQFLTFPSVLADKAEISGIPSGFFVMDDVTYSIPTPSKGSITAGTTTIQPSDIMPHNAT